MSLAIPRPWLAVFWLGYVVLIAYVPGFFPADPALPNAAARAGYDTALAYHLIAVWSVLGLLFFALARHRGWIAAQGGLEADNAGASPARWWQGWLPCIGAGALLSLLYWPGFLARYGIYVEDAYFLSILARMQCGQLPYRDFEFLYGPLMIYPAHHWMNLWGLSMSSYYALLAILQGAFFAITLKLFQLHIPSPRMRYLAFALFVPFALDTLAGLNYIGWRTLLSVLALWLVAVRAHSLVWALVAGALVGLQIAYSFEYGLIALIAIVLVYAATTLNAASAKAALSGLIFVFASLACALAVSWLLAGETLGDFFSATAEVLAYAADSGLGNFRFYWTANTLALFGVLSVVVAGLGAGLARLRAAPMNAADRLVLGATLFALGALKAAIQRADLWHITLPFIPLVLVVLWNVRGRLFTMPRGTRTILLVLIAIAALTRLIGLLPTGSALAAGLVGGARDVLSGVPAAGPVNSRSFSVEPERTHHRQEFVQLGEYLNQPQRSARDVVFYGGHWWLGIRSGVCPGGYATYDLPYSETYRPMRDYLLENPQALVVIESGVLDQLQGTAPRQPPPPQLSTTKKLSSWLSSIHYRQKQAENAIKFELWQQNLGRFLIMNYQPLVRVGEYSVLERRTPPARPDADMREHTENK